MGDLDEMAPIKHICGGDPESCTCMYDPACNPNLKSERLIPESSVLAVVEELRGRGFRRGGMYGEGLIDAAFLIRKRLLGENEGEIAQLRAALANLLTWQPDTEIGLSGLHPQHRAAVESARALNPGGQSE